MTQATILDYALLSNAVYSGGASSPPGWTIFDHCCDDVTSCFALAFQSKKEDVAIIAYRGTINFRNLVADIDILLNDESSIFLSAFAFYVRLKKSLPKTTYLGLTGHSLGGALASFVAFYARYTLFCSTARAYVFNAVPIRSLLQKYYPNATCIDDSFVENFDDQYDVVSHIFGKHQFGQMHLLAEGVAAKKENFVEHFLDKINILGHHAMKDVEEEIEEDYEKK